MGRATRLRAGGRFDPETSTRRGAPIAQCLAVEERGQTCRQTCPCSSVVPAAFRGDPHCQRTPCVEPPCLEPLSWVLSATCRAPSDFHRKPYSWLRSPVPRISSERH